MLPCITIVTAHLSLSLHLFLLQQNVFIPHRFSHSGLLTSHLGHFIHARLNEEVALYQRKKNKERERERERGRGGSQKLLQNACIPSSRSTTPEYTNVNKKDIIKVRKERALTVEIEIKATHLLLHSSFPEFPLLLINPHMRDFSFSVNACT